MTKILKSWKGVFYFLELDTEQGYNVINIPHLFLNVQEIRKKDESKQNQTLFIYQSQRFLFNINTEAFLQT